MPFEWQVAQVEELAEAATAREQLEIHIRLGTAEIVGCDEDRTAGLRNPVTDRTEREKGPQ